MSNNIGTILYDTVKQLAPQQACPAGRHIVCSKKGGNDVLITQFADDQSPPDSEADYDTDLENEGRLCFISYRGHITETHGFLQSLYNI